ncbi:alpha/beta hydrolase [Stenotrophomonas sp. ESTM1D_MKCIP4_1]|uniref:alpha/beta fold hydrolase n=1 Tax=Stenotrophomonas sp. ESTM1D_MKCIP4_1 TaxID=2072414 RepID=UPI000D53CB0A|nr:alpha/beta hydrolase [Stenotrophomonas sp. ESTM1D_MKCIP4_1]AWH52290.1 alpha/beta hydrolase [Stenotrophomonas sp. ESTM1D_MKCIP4_1]
MKMMLALYYAMKALARMAMLGMAMAVLGSGPAHAATPAGSGTVQVEVVGRGRALLMIPGLNSSADVWRETCLALKDVQCHLVQLPGFAGARAADPRPADFLSSMRDQLLAYVHDHAIDHPAVIGHSLGGVLALQMAVKEPQALGPLVIVDAVPFYAGMQNPQATAQSVRPMAEQLRASMLAADPASYQAQADAALGPMTATPARLPELKRWGRDSDRATTADAMYSVMVTDLRGEVAAIRAPTLVLGAWASYQAFGATEASARAIFQSQYAALPGVRIELSATGHHFLMWDDPQWLRGQVQAFLDSHR